MFWVPGPYFGYHSIRKYRGGDSKHQYHLELGECTLLSLLQTKPVRNANGGVHILCFSKHSRWFGCLLRFDNHCFKFSWRFLFVLLFNFQLPLCSIFWLLLKLLLFIHLFIKNLLYSLLFLDYFCWGMIYIQNNTVYRFQV